MGIFSDDAHVVNTTTTGIQYNPFVAALSDYTTSQQGVPQITTLPDGGWVVTWASPGQDGDDLGVYQRVFHIDDHPPATTVGTADQTAPENATFTFQIPADLFSDFEGDAFFYGALVNGTDLPDWLHFDDATRTFSGTPANGDVGPLTVTVIVSSNDGAQTSNTFIINVTNTNDAPRPGGPIWPGSAIEENPFTHTFDSNVFVDMDVGDTLSYSATSADGSGVASVSEPPLAVWPSSTTWKLKEARLSP